MLLKIDCLLMRWLFSLAALVVRGDRSQADAILACDFLTAGLPPGTQACVLAVIEHATWRIRILKVTSHPVGERTAQQARNLLMDLDDQAHQVKFMIRDRGRDFTTTLDAVLADARIPTVPCNVQTPRQTHHHQHRPHRSLRNAAPLKPLPEPANLDQYRVPKRAHVGSRSTNTA